MPGVAPQAPARVIAGEDAVAPLVRNTVDGLPSGAFLSEPPSARMAGAPRFTEGSQEPDEVAELENVFAF
jgi:hypothetical protein